MTMVEIVNMPYLGGGLSDRYQILCDDAELVWVTDHLLLPDHRYGTVSRQICT